MRQIKAMDFARIVKRNVANPKLDDHDFREFLKNKIDEVEGAHCTKCSLEETNHCATCYKGSNKIIL